LTSREKGFLLLTSRLGDPSRKILTVAQLRDLAGRAKDLDMANPNRNMIPSDLTKLGYAPEMAQRILELLSDKELLEYYLYKGRKNGCIPLTRVSVGYPAGVRLALGLDSPGCLWAKGELSLLDMPRIALVGSRELKPENRKFAEEVGRQAARQGYVLVSGNARGADIAAQQACLAGGGKVISVVADRLESHREKPNVLYLAEEGYDMAFSAQRALSRNRVIHALGTKTFVAQSNLSGGTWDGTLRNLQHRYSSVFCFRDGSPAVAELEQMGAAAVGIEELSDFAALADSEMDLFYEK
jgi:predicted Rossmann fold nucleotide-binding protein DprA/Smf involved in DNA uptake